MYVGIANLLRLIQKTSNFAEFSYNLGRNILVWLWLTTSKTELNFLNISQLGEEIS